MENVVQTFEANASVDAISLWTSMVVAIFAFGGMIWLLQPTTRESRNRRILLAMLSFFIFMIACSTAFFSWWSHKKTTPVVLYDSFIETPFGRVSFKEIHKVYLHTDKEKSLVNPNVVKRQTEILVIEEIKGKTHALSEQQYPIRQIRGALKEQMGKQ